MDKNGIGTDATIAQHIQTIQERQYVFNLDGVFVPSSLGLALVEGYDSMGFEFSRPFLRADLEKKLTQICNGEVDKDEVLEEFIQQYEQYYDRASHSKTKLIQSFQKMNDQQKK